MTQTYSRNITFKDYISKTMSTMGIGLGISALTAILLNAINFENILYSLGGVSVILVLGMAIAEIGIGVYFSTRLFKMSKQTAWVCYIVYCVLTGVTLSSLLSFYTTGSVMMAFVTTAVLFVCMSIIGKTTNINLMSISTLLLTGLSAIIILSLLNSLLFHFAFIDMLISYLGVIIFLFMIAYDTQKLNAFYNAAVDSETSEKLMIMSAFQLYLDFINLFIRVLEIFGRRSNDRD